MASWFLTERGLWEDEDLQKALAVSLADAGRLKAANTVLALRRQCEGLTQFPKLGLRLSNGLRKRVFWPISCYLSDCGRRRDPDPPRHLRPGGLENGAETAPWPPFTKAFRSCMSPHLN